jgi:hypothetical protein
MASSKTARRRKAYRVFISHSSEDIWVAEQLAKAVEALGATTFLDVRDIAHGDKFAERIRDELPNCQELLALFTPWSRQRAWVRHEIGMADGHRIRVVCVFYHVRPEDFRPEDGGLGPIDGLNIVDINNLGTYLKALAKRVRA